MNDEELSGLLRSQASRYVASNRLQARVRGQIAVQTAADRARPAKPEGKADAAARGGWRLWWRGRTASMGLGFAGGALATWLAISLLPGWLALYDSHELLHNPLRDTLASTLVADHVRALATGPLTEVASSDRHTVKPWFQGKLDYAPPVIDLAADGYPLLGGRVERINGSATAALVYGAHKHWVTVYVWPADHPGPLAMGQWRGFNLAYFADNSMQTWVVSDMDAAELGKFTQALRSHAQH